MPPINYTTICDYFERKLNSSANYSLASFKALRQWLVILVCNLYEKFAFNSLETFWETFWWDIISQTLKV